MPFERPSPKAIIASLIAGIAEVPGIGKSANLGADLILGLLDQAGYRICTGPSAEPAAKAITDNPAVLPTPFDGEMVITIPGRQIGYDDTAPQRMGWATKGPGGEWVRGNSVYHPVANYGEGSTKVTYKWVRFV